MQRNWPLLIAIIENSISQQKYQKTSLEKVKYTFRSDSKCWNELINLITLFIFINFAQNSFDLSCEQLFQLLLHSVIKIILNRKLCGFFLRIISLIKYDSLQVVVTQVDINEKQRQLFTWLLFRLLKVYFFLWLFILNFKNFIRGGRSLVTYQLFCFFLCRVCFSNLFELSLFFLLIFLKVALKWLHLRKSMIRELNLIRLGLYQLLYNLINFLVSWLFFPCFILLWRL